MSRRVELIFARILFNEIFKNDPKQFCPKNIFKAEAFPFCTVHTESFSGFF